MADATPESLDHTTAPRETGAPKGGRPAIVVLQRGGQGESPRGTLNRQARALDQRWPLTPEQRAEIVQTALELLRDGKSAQRTRLAAARVLVAADQVNVRREATEAADGRQQSADATALLKEGFRSPEARALLARLTELGCLPAPQAGADQATATSDNTNYVQSSDNPPDSPVQ